MPTESNGSARTLTMLFCLYVVGYCLLIASFMLSDNAELKSQWLTHYLAIPNGSPKMAALFFMSALTCMSVSYVVLLRSVLSGGIPATKFDGYHRFVVLLIMLFFSMPPFLDIDIYNYYQQGWVVSEMGSNPYLTPPGAFENYPGSDLTKGANAFAISPYGAIWTQLAHLTVAASAGNVWLGVFLFKVYATIASLAIVMLVSAISRARTQTDQGSLAAAVVGANPLFLIEGPGMGHNDVVAIAVLLLAVFLQLKVMDKKWVGLATVGIASLIKVTVAPAIFVITHWIVRSNTSFPKTCVTLLKAAVLTVLVLSIAGAAFVSKASDIPLLFAFANLDLGYELRLTPVNFLRDLIVSQFASSGLEVSPAWVKAAVLGVFLVTGGTISLWILSRARTWDSYLATLGPIYLIVTVVVSYWRPWYVLWPLSLVVLGPWSRWTIAVIVYSLLAVGTHVITRSTGIFCECI